MSVADGPRSWLDPEYVATVIGVIAVGALYFYSGLVESAPSVETINFVLAWVFVPMVVAYEATRRWVTR